MQLVILYIATVVVFLALDVVGLKNILRPLFEKYIGDLLVDGFRFVPALVFYMFYIGGLLYFVSWPALKSGTPMQALLGGALFGALTYGTYEFTNYATLKAWTPQMVAVDLAWGTFLTGVSAWAGVMIARALA